MLALPDYIVLDFLEWISQNYPRNKGLLDSLLNDKKLAMSYAEEYLHGEYRGCKVYDYKQCKRHLKRYINQVIDSKEFDEFLEKYCECRYCNEDFHYCMYHCLHRCYHKFEYLLHNRFKELRKEPRYELKKIEPYVLVDSLYFYLDQNGITDNPTLMHFMVGYSSKDLSSILDFLNWLKEQNESFNMYKMPEIVFHDVIKKYESSREIKLKNKTKKDIIKCFNNKSPEQVYEWINKVFGRRKIRSLSYIFERYYNDKAKYKCILLPLKGESDLERFVQEYWYDLDAASSDLLDIFYSLKELNNTGFASLEKIKDMAVDIKKLPCIVIWQRDISTAKAISIRKLSHSDLCRLLLEIISCIKKNMDIEQIYKEALKLTENLKDESRMVQKIKQNINGINYGAVTGINEGIVENVISRNNESIQNDIKQAKEKIANIKELNSDMKDFLYGLLDEAGVSILKDDNKLKGECVNKFKGFIAGVGKVSTAILSVLGSVASIASFFGI